jgi:hypothetical protein
MTTVEAYFSSMIYTSGHIHLVTDQNGDTVDIVTFCTDGCHKQWCLDTGNSYEGWYGCQEMPSPAVCAQCGDSWK